MAEKTLKRENKKVREQRRFLFEKTEMVPVKSLKAHPKNPNQGNVPAIAESLEENGMFAPIVVNRRNGFIVAGHHTWLAARKLGWEEIQAVFIDVDETEHRRIMLAANRTADLRTYDEALLGEILASIATTGKGLIGTGYTDSDMADLIQNVGSGAREAAEAAGVNLGDLMDSMPKSSLGQGVAQRQLSSREQYDEDAADDEDLTATDAARGKVRAVKPSEDDAENIEETDQGAELQAVIEVKVERMVYFRDSPDEYHIPYLREDMLLEEIPKNLKTWAGHDGSPDDGKSHYLYNYGLGGIKGLPFDRALLCFYTWDEKFEGWWDSPAWYLARVMSKGCRMAVVPDFSFYREAPRIAHLWNVYRAQYLGRLFQECGMKVAPRLQFNFDDPEHTLEDALRGIPHNPPVLVMSQQNTDDPDYEKKASRIMKAAFAELKPQSLIYYSGPPGRRALELTKFKGEVAHLANYASVRRASGVFGKQEGLGALKQKEKRVALDNARRKLAAVPEEDD